MSTLAKQLPTALTMEGDPRWASILARDPKADGEFYYSVKTTGVYCRPSCAARVAKPENVQFHASPEDARRAGFRPCKRCKPDQAPPSEQHARKIADICRYIESSEEPLTLGQVAQYAGFSPYHLHRVFKALTGLTPKEYAAAHRDNRVRKSLNNTGTVTQAIYDAGYN